MHLTNKARHFRVSLNIQSKNTLLIDFYGIILYVRETVPSLTSDIGGLLNLDISVETVAHELLIHKSL